MPTKACGVPKYIPFPSDEAKKEAKKKANNYIAVFKAKLKTYNLREDGSLEITYVCPDGMLGGRIL